MARQSDVEQLCTQLHAELSVIDAQEYIRALHEILGRQSSTNNSRNISSEKIEEALTRSYQDHSESRQVLTDLVTKDVPHALSVFEKLSPRSIPILVGCFPNMKSTYPLLEELERRIHYGEDLQVKYLLNISLQLLSKFEYNFESIVFLVDELCLRVKENDIKSLMLVIFSLLERNYGSKFERSFMNKMGALIMEAEADIGSDPLAIIVIILTELYPVLTDLCSEVFLGDLLANEFKKKVLAQDDEDFIISLLNLFSIACIDETARAYIAEQYRALLEKSVRMKKYSVLSALVLIKTWSFTKLRSISIQDLSNLLIEVMEQSDKSAPEVLSACIEGLAYLSLKPSIKKSLREKETFCDHLVKLVTREEVDSESYGCLVILANLSAFPENNHGSSKLEPQALKDLKSYSDLKTPTTSGTDEEAVKESKEEVQEFNAKYVITNHLLSSLCSKLGNLSQGAKQQVMRLIYNVTRDRNSIHTCIEHGCIKAVLEFLVNMQKSNDATRLLAVRALTKMLIFTSPSLIFNKYSPVNAIGPLFELIPQSTAKEDDTSFNPDHLTTTDTYEALLALTNLASSEGAQGEDVCKRIVSNLDYWSRLENLMLDENQVLQRSTLELLSNLMSHPLPIAAKFFNFENRHSLKNFNILVKLLELNDLPSQRAVAAIFANITTTVPFIAQELSKQKELQDRMVDVFEEQLDDEGLAQRLLFFFYALINESPDNPYLVGNSRLIKSLERAQETSKTDPQMLEMVSTLLKTCRNEAT